MTPVPFRVVRRRRETKDTFTLELEPAGATDLRPLPGQFTMLYVFGVGEVPISFSGAPGGPLVHTVRAVGAVTEAICALDSGAAIGVRGPFGNSWPIEAAAGGDVVIVAGGIGLAPLRPVVHHVLANRARYGDVVLDYGSRTPQDLLFRPELTRLQRRSDLQVEVTVDAATGTWRGRVGVVPKLVAGARFDPDAASAFVCGPEIMMRFTVDALLERGVSPERIHLSMERNMQCGIGQCGHCQLGPTLICRDGPVYRFDELEELMEVREL
jgi:NAD(P)H-flavin reductase